MSYWINLLLAIPSVRAKKSKLWFNSFKETENGTLASQIS